MAKMESLIAKVDEVENDVNASFDRIINEGQNPEDKIVTIFLGPTGSGKTTLYYALTNKRLIGMKEGRNRYLKANTQNDKFKIGNQALSMTTNPGLEYDRDTDIIFCDCPGFFDNKGDVQDITNSFAIYRVLSHVKNVKILLLVSTSDLKASKGSAIVDACKILENLIPSRPSLQPAIALVITKVDPDLLLPENSNEPISFLSNIQSRDGWLLNVFKESEKNTTNRTVFYFPRPNADMLGNTYSGFDDRNSILDFIRNSRPTQITPFISLSNSAKLTILDNIGSFGDLSELLSDFVRIIQVDYCESDEKLDLWKERVDKLCSITFNTPRDFVKKASDIINPSNERYDQLYTKFIKIDDWKSFLKRIAVEEFDGEENADKCISQNNDLLSPAFLDISKHLHEILIPSHSILLNKIEKRNIDIKKKKTIEELRALAELNEKILKEQQIQKELAIKREHELEVKREERRRQIELQRIRNSGGGGGGGGGCLLI